MRPRLVRRLAPTTLLRCRARLLIQAFANQSQLASTKTRPSLPFLSVPKASPAVVRSFTSERRGWLRHEAKLVVRYTLTLWGVAAAVLVIVFVINEEILEREFPTPPEWGYMTRKYLRDANRFADARDGEINWAMTLELAKTVIDRLEDSKLGGEGVEGLADKGGAAPEVPQEFVSCDISAKSEEWRRGYFEALMLAAKAAEHVDGWARDRMRNTVSAPEFVIGLSNPRPTPIPPGSPHAPREDCEIAFPPADNWYMKILATEGLTPRQKMDAALEYASFIEFKGRADGRLALYDLALAEATQGAETPYDPKTLVLRGGSRPVSTNVLDALTAVANSKARNGDVSGALPIYISVLRARRSLSDSLPPHAVQPGRQLADLVSPPAYPPPPWRSPHERCEEASLHLYIGEILFATASLGDGLAWTRDGVDLAEEQLRALGASKEEREARQTCRECLATGLGNWSAMVAQLAKAEEAESKSASKSRVLSLWSGARDAEGRWAAEEAVVQERVRRTRELMEDLRPPRPGLLSIFRA